MFYFTSFYGNKDSLLYYFYLSAYNVYLGESENSETKSSMPLTIMRNRKLSAWLQDFIAPFYIFQRVWHTLKPISASNNMKGEMLILESNIQVSVFKKASVVSESRITVMGDHIREFNYKSDKVNIQAQWLNL